MTVIIAFLMWLVLAVIVAMRFEPSRTFSVSERIRLVQVGDEVAIDEESRLANAPLLQSLHRIVTVLLTTSFIAIYVLMFGTVNGIIIGAVALLLLPLIYRLPFICNLADRLSNLVLPLYARVTATLRPVLVWLRERDALDDDVTLNSKEELVDLVQRSPGVLRRDETDRLRASLSFNDKKVSDVMTPRSLVKAVAGDEILGPLVIDELHKTGHSRFPVYEKDIDHIIGTLYLYDLIDIKNEKSGRADKVMKSKVHFIRDDSPLSRALSGFLKTKHHLFIVINEYRETVGVLSLEDVLEALIGMEIVDEFDAFDDLRVVAETNPRANNQAKGKEDI